MHILIFEPRHKGHHLLYVQSLIPSLLDVADRVTFIAGADVLASVEFAARIEPFRQHLDIPADLPGLEGSSDFIGGMTDMFRHALVRWKPDHVLVPTADALVQKLGVLALTGRARFARNVDIEACILQCRFAYPGTGTTEKLKRALIRRTVAASPIDRLMTIDGVAYRRMQSPGHALRNRFEMTPDPLEDVPLVTQMEARRQLGLPLDGRYVLLAGALDGRKGTDRLISAFRRARTSPSDRLLIAGKPQPEVQAILASPESQELRRDGKLVTIERILSDWDMMAVTVASDLVCTPYIQHVGPSAMITRALSLGKPVLGTNYGWMGEIVPLLGGGWVCDTAQPDTFAAMIEQALGPAQEIHRIPAAQVLRAYLSKENFAAVWMRRVRAKLGLPPLPETRWEDVVNAARPESRHPVAAQG
jgi:glycosyltransferase involved in cell wall biosynthesis